MARRRETPIELKAVEDVAALNIRAGENVVLWPSERGEMFVVRVARVAVADLVRAIEAGQITSPLSPDAPCRSVVVALQTLSRRWGPAELRDPDRRPPG